MFRDREDAAHLLVQRLKGHPFHDPVVLAIPRGGVVTGAVLARELGAELDVVLSRKLRAPFQPELAIGAVAEDGQVYLEPRVREALELTDEYLSEEQRYQLGEIERRKKLFRKVRPPVTSQGPVGHRHRRRDRHGLDDDRRAADDQSAAAARADRRRARGPVRSARGDPPPLR